MSVTRRTWTDDDGSWTTGTILDNAELQRIYDDIDARWTIAYTFATGTQHNYSITSGGVEADVLWCSNASDLGLTGIAAPASPAKTGKELVIISAGAGHVQLVHQNGGSSAANRLSNLAGSANTVLAAGKGRATYRYDGNTGLWYMVDHDQGGFLPVSFAAGDFTGNGSMTWTLASGDRVAAGTGFWQRGNRVHYAFQLATTTVGGTPNTTLQIAAAQWGGFTAASTVPYRRLAVSLDNGTDVGAYCTVSGTTLQILRANGGNWSASTDNTYLYGDLEFQVT